MNNINWNDWHFKTSEQLFQEQRILEPPPGFEDPPRNLYPQPQQGTYYNFQGNVAPLPNPMLPTNSYLRPIYKTSHLTGEINNASYETPTYINYRPEYVLYSNAMYAKTLAAENPVTPKYILDSNSIPLESGYTVPWACVARNELPPCSEGCRNYHQRPHGIPENGLTIPYAEALKMMSRTTSPQYLQQTPTDFTRMPNVPRCNKYSLNRSFEYNESEQSKFDLLTSSRNERWGHLSQHPEGPQNEKFQNNSKAKNRFKSDSKRNGSSSFDTIGENISQSIKDYSNWNCYNWFENNLKGNLTQNDSDKWGNSTGYSYGSISPLRENASYDEHPSTTFPTVDHWSAEELDEVLHNSTFDKGDGAFNILLQQLNPLVESNDLDELAPVPDLPSTIQNTRDVSLIHLSADLQQNGFNADVGLDLSKSAQNHQITNQLEEYTRRSSVGTTNVLQDLSTSSEERSTISSSACSEKSEEFFRRAATSTPRRSKRRKRHCSFCFTNGEPPEIYFDHLLKSPSGIVTCQILRKHVCEICGATGDNAHTKKYCPKNGNQEFLPPYRILSTGTFSGNHKHK